MAIIFNNTNQLVSINEIRMVVPPDGKLYNIPDGLVSKYVGKLSVIPKSFLNEMKTKQNNINKLTSDLNIKIKDFEIQQMIVLEEKKWINQEKENLNKKIINFKFDIDIDKMDFVYSFCFNSGMFSAIKRLRYSIKSIIKQKVNVCVCNTSKKCIYNEIKDLGKIKYIHKVCNVLPYCKTQTINYGVRNLVNSKYFFISDIDLIYPLTFVDEMSKFTIFLHPVRVVFYNYNMGKEFYSNSFKKYFNEYKKSKDIYRQCFGIAPGNGLIHLESFNKIRGFDEEFIGYGPEDAEFNFRIGYINEYIELNNIKVNTYHLYHKTLMFGDLQKENFIRYNTSKKRIISDVVFPFDEKKNLKFLLGNGKSWGKLKK